MLYAILVLQLKCYRNSLRGCEEAQLSGAASGLRCFATAAAVTGAQAAPPGHPSAVSSFAVTCFPTERAAATADRRAASPAEAAFQAEREIESSERSACQGISVGRLPRHPICVAVIFCMQYVYI